jgi:hypothetical protein
VRFFAARPEIASIRTGLSAGLRALYTVPEDMPDEFLKVFARLDSAKKPGATERVEQAEKGEPLTTMRNTRQGLRAASSVPRLATHLSAS